MKFPYIIRGSRGKVDGNHYNPAKKIGLKKFITEAKQHNRRIVICN